MTRYTKLDGRKAAPARTPTSLFDAAASSSTRSAPAPATPDDHHDAPATKRRRLDSPDAAAPPLTKEAKLKRIKLLRLKAKKAKNDDKRTQLTREVARLERELSSDTAPPSTRDTRDDGASRAHSTTTAETNPWKRMEAERRAKTDVRRDARREKRISERHAALTCFACRGSGHSARECPNALNAHTSALDPEADDDPTPNARGAAPVGKDVVGICFRCGSTSHNLARCPARARSAQGGDDLPFAICFVCAQTGHLASTCPQNAERGVFPRGGGKCALCASVRHRARDCPQAKPQLAEQEADDAEGTLLPDFEGAATAAVRRKQGARKPSAPAPAAPPRKKVVNF